MEKLGLQRRKVVAESLFTNHRAELTTSHTHEGRCE